MDTRHLVDPELLEMLDALPNLIFSDDIFPELRKGSRVQYPIEHEPGPAVTSSYCTASGHAGGPVVRLHVQSPHEIGRPPALPDTRARRRLRHRNVEAVAPALRSMAHALQCVVVSVDYRFVPETIAPGQIEDAYAALAWVGANAAALAVDPGRLGLIEESSGGGLAAALALLARDRVRYRIRCLNTMYPMLDDRTCVAPARPYAGHHLAPPQVIR